MSNSIASRDADEDGRVALARRYLDSAEMWLRRLIEFEFSKKFGSNYFRDGVVKSNIRHSVEKLKASSPGKFSRDIDATSFEQLTDISTNHDHFKNVLSDALVSAYPLGAEQLKFNLNKLLVVRNSVQHGNGCTERQLEQSICYSNDLTDAIKGHFKKMNMARSYNVPTIAIIKDNKGHRIERSQVQEVGNQGYADLRSNASANLYPGEILNIEIEVDQSFDPTTYKIEWQTFNPTSQHFGNNYSFEITERHINDALYVNITVISNKAWHKHGSHDDKIALCYRVLPPP